MVFGNGVKNIQAAAYNGTRTLNMTSDCKSALSMPLECPQIFTVPVNFVILIRNPINSVVLQSIAVS